MPNNYQFYLNSAMSWNMNNNLPPNVPVWVLAEEDTCDPTQIPSVFRVMFDPNGPTSRKVRMLDYDPEEQEDALSANNWVIVAWRPMTDHGGTFDRYYAAQGVTERSNWTMTLDKNESDTSEASSVLDNHYKFLERNFDTILTRMGKEEWIGRTGNFVSSGDKYRQYKEEWEAEGISYFHGAAMYHLMEFLYPNEVRQTKNGWVDPHQWVIDNYRGGRNLSQYMKGLS